MYHVQVTCNKPMAKYKWEVHVNVRFHMNVRIPTHCMAQDGRRVPPCGQGRQFGDWAYYS